MHEPVNLSWSGTAGSSSTAVPSAVNMRSQQHNAAAYINTSSNYSSLRTHASTAIPTPSPNDTSQEWEKVKHSSQAVPSLTESPSKLPIPPLRRHVPPPTPVRRLKVKPPTKSYPAILPLPPSPTLPTNANSLMAKSTSNLAAASPAIQAALNQPVVGSDRSNMKHIKVDNRWSSY